MATSIPNALYKYNVNGVTIYEAGPQVPWGASPVSPEEFLQGTQNLIDKYNGSDSWSQTFTGQLKKWHDSVMNGSGGDSGYVTLTPEEQQKYGFSSNFVQKGSLDYAIQQKADIASGALVPIGTAANGQLLYAPSGSAAVKQAQYPNQAQYQGSATQPTPTATGAATSTTPTASTPIGATAKQPPSVSLQPGATGDAVKQLQDYLVSQGMMTQADVNTGYGTYGPKTTAAVKALQEKLGVDNSTGVGYWGPKTLQAVTASASTNGSTTGANGGVSGATNATQEQLATILQNPNLTADQKAIAQKIYDVVSTNDQSQAQRLKAAFDAATQYSDPFFKAQVALATDTLTRSLSANEGNLEFQQNQLNKTLTDLQNNIAASKGQLDFTHQQELDKLAKSYKVDLENTQQNLASLGKTSSSVRAQSEQLLNEQNQGLVESSNRGYSYQTGNLDRNLASTQGDTAAKLAQLQSEAAQKRIDALRTAESQVGSKTLMGLGYNDLLGGVGGSIPRTQATDALSFANSFVGTDKPLDYSSFV